MHITSSTKLKDIDSAYPNFRDVGARQYPVLKKLSGFVWMMAKNMTVNEAAEKANMSTDELISKINDVISQC